MYAKVHESVFRGTERRVIAACDAELLGKVFGEKSGDGALLDLKKYRGFYEGRRVTPEELAFLLKDAQNVNLVGKKTIAAAGKALPLSLKDAKLIGGVPHVQYYKF